MFVCTLAIPIMPPSASAFPETSWTLVLRAADAGGAEAQAGALDARAALFRTYWSPVYAYLRRRGLAHSDAEDQAQGLFARLLAEEGLTGADPKRGRFRSYLLSAVGNQLINAWRHTTAAKRDARLAVSVDALERPAVERLLRDETSGPDEVFDAAWARLLLRNARDVVASEWRERGRARVFGVLGKFLLSAPEGGDYAGPARALEWTENAVKVEVFRLRRRFREVLRLAVAATVTDADQIDDELRHLAAVAARHPMDEPEGA